MYTYIYIYIYIYILYIYVIRNTTRELKTLIIFQKYNFLVQFKLSITSSSGFIINMLVDKLNIKIHKNKLKFQS